MIWMTPALLAILGYLVCSLIFYLWFPDLLVYLFGYGIVTIGVLLLIGFVVGLLFEDQRR